MLFYMVYLLVARCVACLGLYLFGCFSWYDPLCTLLGYWLLLLVCSLALGLGLCCSCLTLLGLFCVLFVCFGCGVVCACLRPYAVWLNFLLLVHFLLWFYYFDCAVGFKIVCYILVFD